MYKLLLLGMLFSGGIGSVYADVPTCTLRGHETRINAFHEKMKNEGAELSKEFLAIHNNLSNGKYDCDYATARKVLKEVYSERLPQQNINNQ